MQTQLPQHLLLISYNHSSSSSTSHVFFVYQLQSHSQTRGYEHERQHQHQPYKQTSLDPHPTLSISPLSILSCPPPFLCPFPPHPQHPRTNPDLPSSRSYSLLASRPRSQLILSISKRPHPNGTQDPHEGTGISHISLYSHPLLLSPTLPLTKHPTPPHKHPPPPTPQPPYILRLHRCHRD